MKAFKKDILGTPYLIMYGLRSEIDLDSNLAGCCRVFTKQILIATDMEDCENQNALEVRIQETIAHEVLHAFLNESGVDIDEGDEEKVCCFYMKNWRKLHTTILDIIRQVGLDKSDLTKF